MIRFIAAIFALLVTAPAMAADWYISPSSPFASRNIEGTQCRYLRITSLDSGFTPALDVRKLNAATFTYDLNTKTSGSGAITTTKSCTNSSSTATCSDYFADTDGDGDTEVVSFSSDVALNILAPDNYVRLFIDTQAISPGGTMLTVCGVASGPGTPGIEVDPVFGQMDTEQELETKIGGINIWTENDGPLGGGGGGSGSDTDLSLGAQTDSTVQINSNTGNDVVIPSATTTLAGVMSAADKNKLIGVATGATVGLGSDPSGCAPGTVATDQNQSGVLVCTPDDDEPESGEFANAAALEADGSLSVNSVTNSAMQDDSVGIAELSAAGTASGSTFLRGDNVWATPPGGGVGGATDLSLGAQTSTTVNIDSSTGTSATIPSATTSAAGAMSSSDKSSIDDLKINIWNVNTAAELNTAITECAAYTVANDTAGEIRIIGQIVEDSTGDTGGSFKLPAVYRGAPNSVLKAPCKLKGITSDVLASSSDALGSSIICNNTSAMTAVDGMKACVVSQGDGQVIEDLNIITSTGSDSSTVGLLVRAPNSDGFLAGARANRNVVLDNVSVQTEDVTSSGRGIVTEFVLGGEFDIRVRGYSTAGLALLDRDVAGASNNAIRVSGRIQSTGDAILIDGDLSCQDLYLDGMIIEGNARGVHLTSTATCRVNISNTHIENDKDDSLFAGTEGIFNESANAVLNISNSFFDNDLANLDYHIRTTAARASGLPKDSITGVSFRSNRKPAVTYVSIADYVMNGVRSIYYCDEHSGSDIGAKCNSAFAQMKADGRKGGILEIGTNPGLQTTTIDVCEEGTGAFTSPTIRGQGRGVNGAKGGTVLAAASGFASTNIVRTNFTVGQDNGPGGRDKITCTGCDFVAAGFRRGDLIETTGFASANNNYHRAQSDATRQFPLKVYSASTTEIVVENESSIHAGLVTATTVTAGDVRRLKAQIETCTSFQNVEGIQIDGNQYADLGIHHRPDNSQVSGCISAGVPYAGCTGLGTGSVSIDNSIGNTVNETLIREHTYYDIAATALEAAGQSDHYVISNSHLGAQSVGGFWYDSMQAQPGPVVRDTQVEDFKRFGILNSSGTINIDSSTIISNNSDCIADTYGESAHVEMRTSNTLGLHISNSNIETRCGKAIKIGSVTNQIRGLTLTSNFISANADGETTTPTALLDAPGFCGPIVNTSTWTGQAGTGVPTVSIANSNHPTCETTIDGFGAYRNMGLAEPILLVANGIYRDVNSYDVPAVNNSSLANNQTMPGRRERYWFTHESAAVGTDKPKAAGIYRQVVGLTDGELFGLNQELVGGGSADTVGLFINTFGTGGSPNDGDEGLQGGRFAVRDVWLTAAGTVTDPITSATGNITVPISTTEGYSAYIGENKLLVMTASAVSVDITSLPPGALKDSDNTYSAGTWSTAGSHSHLIGIEDGIVMSDDSLNGKCFASTDSQYLDINSVLTPHWLYIVDSDDNVSGDTITTQWIAQNVDTGIPYGYKAEIGVDEGIIANCAKIVKPVFAGGEGDLTADSIIINKINSWTALDNAAWQVASYGEHYMGGLRILLNRKLGRHYPSVGITMSPEGDSYTHDAGVQLTAGAGAPYDSSHPWETGFKCTGASTCRFFMEYSYRDNDLGATGNGASGQYPFRIVPGTNDWNAGDLFNVIKFTNPAGSVYDTDLLDLTLSGPLGWGQNGEPFMRASVTDDSINGGSPNGAGAKVHWSQLLGVPAGFADGSDDGTGGGGTNLDSLTDVVITTPATGATVKFDGTNWIDGALDLADGDAVTGILGDSNVSDSLTIIGSNISITAITLLGSDTPVNTVEGSLVWDTNDDRLSVGTGGGTAVFHSGPHTTSASALITGTLAIAQGGTGSNDAATARTALDVQQADSDLNAIAGLTTTAHGRGLLDDADAAASRASIGAQQDDADLTNIAALTTTAHGRGLLDDADAAASRTSLGVVIGTNVQAYDADLDDLALDGVLQGSRVQVFGAANAGVVPLSGGGTTNFLRADGTWAAAGSGSSGWTDSGAVVEPTSVTDDVGIGYDGAGAAATDWAFYFDESAGLLRINVPGGSIDVAPSATDGGCFGASEGTDDGAHSTSFCVSDSAIFDSDKVVTSAFTADGLWAGAAIGVGVIDATHTNEASIAAAMALSAIGGAVTDAQVPNNITVDLASAAAAMSGSGQIDDTDLAAGAVDGGSGGEIADGTVDANDLASTTVTPGSYTAADITVDADGRITAAANGSGGGTWNPVTEINNLRSKPICYTDLTSDISTGTTGDAGEAGFGCVNYLAQAGATAVVEDDSALDHPGIVSIAATAAAGSGGGYLSSIGAFRLGGGEVYETIVQIKPASGTNVLLRAGFHDSNSGTSPFDGVWIQFDALTPTCHARSNNTSASAASISGSYSNNTWYRLRVTVVSTSNVTCEIFDDSGTLLGSASQTTNIPSGTGRNVGARVVVTHNAGDAALPVLAWIDWIAYAHNRALTR